MTEPTPCLFCRIIAGEIPATLVYIDEEVVAFRDVNPQAPVHVLVVPREHVRSVADITPEQSPLWARLLHVAQKVAQDEGLDPDGWRLVSNVGPNAGQTVDHLHLHVLGGRSMSWPPG
jgi:histidine triad (HIT) family protein